MDVDFDVSQEVAAAGGRYTTRRSSAAAGARASTRLQDAVKKQRSGMGRVDSFAGQQVRAGRAELLRRAGPRAEAARRRVQATCRGRLGSLWAPKRGRAGGTEGRG